MPCDPAPAPPSILPLVSMLSAVSSYLMLFLATKPLLLLLSLLDNFVQPSYILQNSVPAAARGWWGASPCAHSLCFVPNMLYRCDLLAGLLPLNWPLFPRAGTVYIPACSTALGTHRSSRYL